MKLMLFLEIVRNVGQVKANRGDEYKAAAETGKKWVKSLTQWVRQSKTELSIKPRPKRERNGSNR
jgi:hypothetical protein